MYGFVLSTYCGIPEQPGTAHPPELVLPAAPGNRSGYTAINECIAMNQLVRERKRHFY